MSVLARHSSGTRRVAWESVWTWPAYRARHPAQGLVGELAQFDADDYRPLPMVDAGAGATTYRRWTARTRVLTNKPTISLPGS